MPDWHTPTTARARWAGAPKDDAVLQELLDAARYMIEDYAEPIPANADGSAGDIPVTWPLAQVRQARALYEAARAAGAEGDEIGLDAFALRSSADMSAGIRRLIGSVRTPGVG